MRDAEGVKKGSGLGKDSPLQPTRGSVGSIIISPGGASRYSKF